MAVRNQRLYAAQLTASGVVTAYTVPAATWVLLKSITATNSGGSPQAFSVGMQAGVGGVSVDILSRLGSNTLAAAASVFSGPWVALNPGDLIYVNMSGAGNLGVWLAGAVLT